MSVALILTCLFAVLRFAEPGPELHRNELCTTGIYGKPKERSRSLIIGLPGAASIRCGGAATLLIGHTFFRENVIMLK
jgi:hypothetical protein